MEAHCSAVLGSPGVDSFTICSSGHYGPEKLKIETMYQVPQRPLIAQSRPEDQPALLCEPTADVKR
jgi:hypothetical protein